MIARLEIRKTIYTTNAIESRNRFIRKSICTRKIFPSDQSAFKNSLLGLEEVADYWAIPIRNWKSAMKQLAIEYKVTQNRLQPLFFIISSLFNQVFY
ncbi:MAG: transposase [Chromatiales bacterium]|nr:transposase [Chromatiales bacterium]